MFARPYKYDTSDLIQAIRHSLKPSGDENKVLQEEILHRIKNHQDQTFLRKMDNNNHERLSLKSLDLMFSWFHGYFFKNTFPQDTKIVRENHNLSLTPKFSLRFKTASSLGAFAVTTRITHDLTRKVDRTKSPHIILPSRGTFSNNSSPGDDVSALLKVMIDLYPQWYSCRKASCVDEIAACGKAYRGQARQNIVNILEKSEVMDDMQTLIGSQVRLRRYEEFVRESSFEF